MPRRNELGNVSFRFQRNIARFSGSILPALACQFGYHHIAGQLLPFCSAAHNIHINVAAVVRNRTKFNPVSGCIDFLTFSILLAGSNPLAHRRDMNVFNIPFCLQICVTCRQACATLLDNVSARRLNCQCCIFRIVLNIVIQIDVARYCVCVGYADASVLLTDKTDTDGLICFQRISIGLGRPRLCRPGHPIGRIGPQRPPVPAFFSAAGNSAGILGLNAFHNCAEFCAVYPILVIKGTDKISRG